MVLSLKKSSAAAGDASGRESSRERFLAFFSHKKAQTQKYERDNQQQASDDARHEDKRERKRYGGSSSAKARRRGNQRQHLDKTELSGSSDDAAVSPHAGVRLCQSPGSRSTAQLPGPVQELQHGPHGRDRDASSSSTSSSCVGVFPQRSSRSSSLQWSSRSSSASWSSSSSSSTVSPIAQHSDIPKPTSLVTAHRPRRSSSSDSAASSVSSVSARDVAQPREMWRESSVADFLASCPRDLTPDVRVTCQVTDPRAALACVRALVLSLEFEVRATKWAAYFLQLVTRARHTRQLSLQACVSVQWAICGHVRGEAQMRQARQARLDLELQRKMTAYRVALQCIAGMSVTKFGRKGKPHATTLAVENGDTLRWTSKLLAQATQLAVDGVTATTTMGKKRVAAKNAIPLASILRVTAGPTSDVLARALQKGTLALSEAKCTLSVVTRTRTLDLKAKSPAERDWLQRSLEFLVELARDHERRVAQQVELTIMKRMETLAVWKHGRKGKPHKTRVFVDRFGEVSWLGRSGDSLQLDEIVAVREGQRTPVFSRARAAGLVSSAHAAMCFSLVTPLRTLDIEAASEQQRDWFVVAFRYLLDKVHEKTAAMQRERAEKQLRMLQELCAGEVPLDEDGNDLYDGGPPPPRG